MQLAGWGDRRLSPCRGMPRRPIGDSRTRQHRQNFVRWPLTPSPIFGFRLQLYEPADAIQGSLQRCCIILWATRDVWGRAEAPHATPPGK